MFFSPGQGGSLGYCVGDGFLPSSAASGTAVGKCSTHAPAAVKGGGKGPMGFSSMGSQGQLELLPCPSWGQQEGCEHPLWHLPPLRPKSLVPVFGVAWQVEGSHPWRGGAPIEPRVFEHPLSARIFIFSKLEKIPLHLTELSLNQWET